MIIGNIVLYDKIPIRWRGGALLNPERSNYNDTSSSRNFFVGEGGIEKKASIPNGYVHPYAWVLAQQPGGMAIHNGMIGTGNVSAANLAGGKNAEATIGGSTTITNAAAGLIVSAVATLSGLSTLSADIIGKLEATATLAGSGNITAALGALAGLTATLLGSSVVSSGTLLGKGNITASLTPFTELSPENLAAAVWNAVATAFNEAGSMGQKLNDAGGAGNPWNTAVEGAHTAGQLMKTMSAVLLGKTDITDLGGGSATVKFRDINDVKDRVTAGLTSSERTTVTLDET